MKSLSRYRTEFSCVNLFTFICKAKYSANLNFTYLTAADLRCIEVKDTDTNSYNYFWCFVHNQSVL